MEIDPSEFYLAIHDLKTQAIIPDKLTYYDRRSHHSYGGSTGMTGSGKRYGYHPVEEAALKGIPAILIDPKGDLDILHFPDFLPRICACELMPPSVKVRQLNRLLKPLPRPGRRAPNVLVSIVLAWKNWQTVLITRSTHQVQTQLFRLVSCLR